MRQAKHGTGVRWRSWAVLGCLAGMALSTVRAGTAAQEATNTSQRPNILWFTVEDMGPHIGPYGDRYADTPNLDRFALRALRYDNAWSNAPVCAPARTTLISGLYPPSTGSEHMRSVTRLPNGVKMYPQFLREIGYYCTNNSKTDYNLEEPGKVWDASSNRAHWRNRKPGQPFFAVFNTNTTHESQIRRRPHTLIHDPAKAPLPSYHPDTPEIRRDWAQYYDNITTMDREFGQRLQELDEAELADDTIVFYYSDHGSGMPRSKRWPYNSGLRIPLLVHFPPKYRHLAPKEYREGDSTDRLVSFVDLAPTLLSLVGIKPAAYHQGHAFMGKHESPPQQYLYGFRGRMDERYDLVRCVRDQRYLYIRNYIPHRIYGQYIDYMFQTPTTRVWKELYDAGKLKAPQTFFWEPKPVEELYDLRNDPDEVKNLAASPAHRDILQRLRRKQQDLALKIRDVGFMPEAEMHARAGSTTPYEMARQPDQYPVERVVATAELAASRDMAQLPKLKAALRDPDSVVRYWAAQGYLIRGAQAVSAGRAELWRLLSDASPSVRIVAAEALGIYGRPEDLQPALDTLGELLSPTTHSYWTTVQALGALDELGDKARPLVSKVRPFLKEVQSAEPRTRSYAVRLAERIVARGQQ